MQEQGGHTAGTEKRQGRTPDEGGQLPALTLRGKWKPSSRGAGELLGAALLVLDGERVTVTGYERITPPGWVIGLWILAVLLFLSGGGIPIALILVLVLRGRGKRPFDRVVPREGLRLDPLPPDKVRVSFVAEVGSTAGLIKLDRASRTSLRKYLKAVGLPPRDFHDAGGPLQLKGRWYRHWRLGGELFGRARIEVADLGLILHGRRTNFVRSFVYLGGLVFGLVLASVVALALPVLAGWLAVELGEQAEEAVILGLIASGLLIVAVPPAWLIWRRVLLPPVTELIPWSLIDRVGALNDGLWIRALSSRGDVHGHLRRAPLSDLQRLEQVVLDRAPSVVKITARDAAAPLWFDRAVVVAAALLALGAVFALRQAPPDWLARLQAGAASVVEEDPDAERKKELDSVRRTVAAEMQRTPYEGWNGRDSIDKNARSLGRQLRVAVGAVPRGAPYGAESAAVEVFATSIDYGAILDEVSFGRSVGAFVRVADELDRVSADAGNAFIVYLGAAYIARFPPSVEGIETRFEIAESWVDAGRTETREACTLVGRFLVGRLADAVRAAYKGGDIDREVALAHGRTLESLGSNLDLPMGSMQKLMVNLAAGNSGYIAQRGGMKLKELVSNPSSSTARAARAAYRLDLKAGGAGGRWKAGKLYRDGARIGWVGLATDNGTFARSAWIPAQGRSLSVQTVAGILGRRRPMAMAAGSYVTSQGRTSGLAMAGGEVVNFAADGKMDGLVLFHRGQLSIHDIRRGITLPGSSELLDPLASLSDYQQFIEWAKEERASCFQTHLLAADGALAIDPDRASPEPRERRLLATIKRGRDRGMALIDLPADPRPVSIAEAGAIGLKVLDTAGWEVEGLANLDVGSFNILVSTTGSSRVDRIGPLPPSKAHNLVVIYER